MAKFMITFGRKVQTVQYESMMFELTAEFDGSQWD